MTTLFKSLAELLDKVEGTQKRLEIIDLTAAFLKGLEPDEVEPAVSMILGRAFPKYSPKNLDVSWITLTETLKRVTAVDWNLFSEAFSQTGDVGAASKAIFEKSRVKRQALLFEKALTILEVQRNLEAIADASGYGSREKKNRLITTLLSQASPSEAKYLVKILIGEMRTGLHEGLMEQAIAKAYQTPLPTIQKASMFLGDVAEVAAKIHRNEDLNAIGFKVSRPVQLMLAQTANNVSEALREHGGESAFEFKYDGARVQIHKLGSEVQVFSRRLTDVTASLPEIVEMVKRNVKSNAAILEGEIIAVDSAGLPIPFQHLMRRFKRVHGVENMSEKIPLKLYVFDLLFAEGESLIEQPYLKRRETLLAVAGGIPLTAQLVTKNVSEAEQFLNAALKSGHEGLMAKKPDSPYTPGTRGKRWLKIKPIMETLDLVIVAAEYGYGRRHDWLSDYYLAARDAETGEFLTVGKTFKGLTDAEIIEMTKRLKALTISEQRRRVTVVPRVVVEVAYNEIQTSPKYKSQMALRFARITRIRDDKDAEDVDTVQRVREIYEQQFSKKGRYKTT